MSKFNKSLSSKNVEEYVNERKKKNEVTEYTFKTKGAVDVIKKYIAENKSITVIGDYDADGICASAIMGRAICFAGGSRVSIRLPLRFSEGYGMNPNMVKSINEGLIITVDNGIAAHEAVKMAKEKGLEVIITDHHRVKSESQIYNVNGNIHTISEPSLPDTDYIIDPHLEEVFLPFEAYDYDEYCGAGIALKVAEELLGKEHPALDKFYALAAVATIADVMPITGDNVNIIKRGMGAITKGNIDEGLYYLFEVNGIKVDELPKSIPAYAAVTSETIGYQIGPCINAASRMYDDGAKKALECIVTKKREEAAEAARYLADVNKKRKEITENEQGKIDAIIKSNGMENDCPIVIHFPDCAPGIIGLHAGRLCEQYKVPVIVINGHGEKCKGSCRSPEGINIEELLKVGEDLMQYGGHSRAAGLTIPEDNIPELKKRLIAECKKKGYVAQKTDEYQVDMHIKDTEVEDTLAVLTNNLAPFGEGNRNPQMLIDAKIDRVSIIAGKHLKITTTNGLQCIGYYLAGEGDIPDGLRNGAKVTLYGELGYDCFRGKASPKITFSHILGPDDEIINDKNKGERKNGIRDTRTPLNR